MYEDIDWNRRFSNADASFGMERGVAIPNTNGAVIPPGRYWLDTFTNTQAAFNTWLAEKPEVRLESTQDAQDSTGHVFNIFTIPSSATNYGKPGVWFPTTQLGFPTSAAPDVTSSDDTVQKPDAPTSGDVIADFAKTTGKVTSGILDNISTGTMIKLAIVGGVVILVATLPSTILPMLVSAQAAIRRKS